MIPSKQSCEIVASVVGRLLGASTMIKLERDFGTIEAEKHWKNAVVKTDALLNEVKETFKEKEFIGWDQLRLMLRLACKRTLADLGE